MKLTSIIFQPCENGKVGAQANVNGLDRRKKYIAGRFEVDNRWNLSGVGTRSPVLVLAEERRECPCNFRLQFQ